VENLKLERLRGLGSWRQIHSDAFDVLAEGILFDEFEWDNIEAVGEREIVQFGGDRLSAQSILSHRSR